MLLFTAIPILLGVLQTTSPQIANADFNPTTIPESVDKDFYDECYSKLSFTIRTNYYYIGYEPILQYGITEEEYDPYLRYLRFYVDNALVYTGYISGTTTGEVQLHNLIGSGTHTVTIEVYCGNYGNGPYELDYAKIGRLGWDQSINKIAVFFWRDMTDGGTISQGPVDQYCSILANEGFTTIQHKNPAYWGWDMDNLDAMEDANSMVFIYISGHGCYSAPFLGNDYSKVTLSSNQDMTSIDFRTRILNLESCRIMVVVESCQSGDFVHELNMDRVSVITTADESHNAVGWVCGDWSEGYYSEDFFDAIAAGKNGYYSHTTAAAGVPNQYPLSSFRAYSPFFAP